MAHFRQSSGVRPRAARIQKRYSLSAAVLVFFLAGVAAAQTAPSITNLSPSAGPIAASVTISGSNFGNTQGTSTVTFNGTMATSITSWSASSITAIVPSAATTGNVVVAVTGTASNGVNFTVIPNAFPGPISYAYDELGRLVGAVASTGDAVRYSYDAVGNITSITRYSSAQVVLFSFTPESGVVGTQVTIYGSNFSPNAAQDTVSFNGTNATIVSASPTQLVVTVPTGTTTGPITVTAPLGSVTSSGSFTVLNSAPPTITSFTPTIALQGTTIALTGTNFDPTPQNDRLFMNVTPAPVAASPAPTTTSMSAVIPTFTGSGHISLTTQGGTAVSTGDLFIPPPGSGVSVAQVAYTGRTTLNTPTTVTLPNSSSFGMLLFDGIAGHTLSASLTPVGGTFNYQLYSPDGTPLGGPSLCNTSCFEVDRLHVSGTYTIVISYASVTITLTDSTPITTTITPNGSAVTLNLSGIGQDGRLTFNATAGQQAAVQVSSNTISSVTVSLLSPDGSTVRSVSSTAASFSLPTAMLPQSGLHTILVHPANTSTGSITISLTLAGGTRPVPSRPSGTATDPSSPLYANLVGLFVMNEGSGTTTQNLVDGQTASFSGAGAPTWNASDPSIAFSGGASLNSYLNAGTDLSFDQLPASKMTVAAKIYLSNLSAGSITEKYYNSQGFIFSWDSIQEIYFKVGPLYVVTSSQALAADRWIQVAATWDGTLGSAANAHIFVDGVEQIKATTVDSAGRQSYYNATNQPLYVGSASTAGYNSLNGKMAYFAVYRGRMLSGAELNQLDSQLPLTADVIGTITENGSAVTKTTTSPGQGVQLKFQAWYGQQVTVQLSGNTMGSVTVNLVKPDGTVLATTTSSASSFNVPSATLPINGQFDVVIRPTGTTTGSITTNLSAQGAFRPQGSVLDTTNALSTNLAGMFIMNEASGTTDKNLVDSQTASFSGTSVPTWNTVDPAVVFNGGTSLNSYLNAGTDLTFDQLTPGKMTIVAKLYVSDPSPAAGVAEKNDGDSINSGFEFGWDNNGALRLLVERSVVDMRVISAKGSIPYGQWIQVACTWDGSVGTAAAAHLFLNGAELSKASSSDGSGTIGYTNATNQPFRIGNASFDPMAGSLNGKIAYVVVYKGRILTTTEMNQLDAQLPIH